MERDEELKRLLFVLQRLSRTAARIQWTGAGEAEAHYAVTQYNKVLARLTELEPALAQIFEPLAADATLTVAAMAARQTAAYFEAEVSGESRQWDWAPPGFGKGCTTQFNFEDVGNWVRDWMSEFQRQEKEKRADGKATG